MNVIYEWAVRSLAELGASPFDVFLVIALIGCAIQHARLSAKYQLLNTNLIRACDEVYRLGGMRILGQHRGGDSYTANPLFDHLDRNEDVK